MPRRSRLVLLDLVHVAIVERDAVSRRRLASNDRDDHPREPAVRAKVDLNAIPPPKCMLPLFAERLPSCHPCTATPPDLCLPWSPSP